MNPGFPPPPPGSFFPNMHMPLINLSGQFPQLPPMGGMMPIRVGMPPPLPAGMGITVPTGVASISAPPVRNIIPTAPTAILQQPPKLTNPLSKPSIIMRPQRPSGPPITVFVGNITERASDQLIRQLLAKCGQVSNWKRVHGANGKLQAFGFCDFVYEESAIRAIRLLHDLEVCDKKLLVKVDAKTQERLEKFVKDKKPSDLKNNEEKEDRPEVEKESENKEKVENEETVKSEEKNGNNQANTFSEFLDEETRNEDERLVEEIEKLLNETNFEPKISKNDSSKDQLDQKSDGPKPDNFADMDIDNEKKNLIHREIGKFRDAYKKQDEEKEKREKEREHRRELDRQRDDRDRKRDDRPDRDRMDRDRSNFREREKDRERDRLRDRERDRDRERRERRSRSPMLRDRNGRRPDRDRFERDSRESREVREARDPREDVDDESAFERRKLERELRKKEQSYQERLKNWESRETRKQKEREKERLKHEQRLKSEAKEITRLKQFLEDYNDEVDDTKYYKGSVLQRKLKEREKEKEEDENDRLEEKRELEELRQKLAEEGIEPPPNESTNTKVESMDISATALAPTSISLSAQALTLSANKEISKEKLNNGHSVAPVENQNENKKDDEFHVKAFSLTKNPMVASSSNNYLSYDHSGDSNTPMSDSQASNSLAKKVKPSVQEVFNTVDEEESETFSKRRRLPLFDDNTDSNQSSQSNQAKSSSLSAEEKRKKIKALIDSIPTSKEDLFKYTIDWSIVDSHLMEKRIRPWINKKITEYIGEEEVSLLDFICTKLNAKCNAQSILNDVAMVLDEEAEVFVMKMWRLLIYEIEMKKSGLVK